MNTLPRSDLIPKVAHDSQATAVFQCDLGSLGGDISFGRVVAPQEGNKNFAKREHILYSQGVGCMSWTKAPTKWGIPPFCPFPRQAFVIPLHLWKKKETLKWISCSGR
uniref:Uncharacterized protein n=1 Tax=Trypanosoma vivax (strain Y486) TaxID=1055687 RepID=G0TZW2_TRYVY|nr:hypothetical protein, unlikely [Trypanosoma vivax Y486]